VGIEERLHFRHGRREVRLGLGKENNAEGEEMASIPFLSGWREMLGSPRKEEFDCTFWGVLSTGQQSSKLTERA